MRKKAIHEDFFMMWQETPQSPSHPSYERFHALLPPYTSHASFQKRCRPLYTDRVNRLNLPCKSCIRMLFIGHCEGLESGISISWRCADSHSLFAFLRLAPTQYPPNDSTLSHTRSLSHRETRHEVLGFVQRKKIETELSINLKD